MPTITEAEVTTFVARCQEIVNAYYTANFSNLTPPTLEFDYASAKKFVRIVSADYYHEGPKKGQRLGRSAWCFIDLETGDVLKSDGWKRPAKHSRGHIGAEDLTKFIGPHGPAYLK